jgi:tripartite ATP-independent transporter DctM subunit
MSEPVLVAEPNVATPTPAPLRRHDWTFRVVFAGLAALSLFLIFSPSTSPMITGGAALLLMIVLMFAKFPVAIALGLPGLLGLYALTGSAALETVMSTLPYHATAQWSLTVIPMFVMMGLLLWTSGVTSRMYVAAQHWLGWLPGGLAVGTNAAGAGLAAVSGSTIGVTYALARIGIPEMLKAGYDRRLAIGSVVVAGLGGQLIPPSIMLVIYAGIAEVPVGPQLTAGVGPGIFIALMFGLMLAGIALVSPATGGWRVPGARQQSTAAEKLRSLLSLIPVALLLIIVIGGIFSGTLTATEAGAAGAFGALITALILKRHDKPLQKVVDAATATAATTGAIFLMLVGAHILSQLLAVSGIGAAFTAWVSDLGLGPVQFLLLMMVAYLIMGMFMDPLSMMLLTVPLLLPVMKLLEISPLWFGVFAVFMGEMAVLTPPVGILSYIIHSICQDRSVNMGHKITLGDVFTAVLWFMPMTIVVVVLLILFPEIATWLPEKLAP